MKGFKPFPFIALALYFCVLTACGHGHPPNGPGALNISNKKVPDGVVLSPYNVTLGTVGGQGPFTWTLNSGALPGGLSLSSGGVISGTPPITDLDASGNAKTYNFVVKVTDSQTPTAAFQTGSFAIIINPLPVVTSTTPPNGTIGLAYNYPLTNSGGLAPFTWTVISGALPAGLSVVGSAISGTPTGTGCGPSPFTIQVTDADSNTATAQLTITIVGKLQGNNAFSFNGFDHGQPFYAVGSFVGDCTGNITSGVLDQNDFASGLTTKTPFTGTYTLDSSINVGSLSFTIPALNNVTHTYNFAVPLNGDLDFILADSNHPEIYGSGVIKAQTLPTLGISSLCPLTWPCNWAMGFFGVDPGGNRSAGAGSFKADSLGNLTSGIQDTNDNGVLGQMLPFTGTWVPDADFATTGRGTITLNVGSNALHYAFYVVNPKNELVALQTDLVSSGASLSLASVLQPVLNVTGGGLSSASLNGSSVMKLNGGNTTSSPSPDVALGVGQFDGNGHITLFQTDENKGGTYIPATAVTGTYNVDPTTGRVTVGLPTGPPPVWYLVGQNSGFVIGTDSSVTQGSFEPQSGSPFSLPSFLFRGVGGTIQPVLASVTNEVDSTDIPFPGGTLVVTYDASGGPGSPPPPPVFNQMLSSVYALGDDPGSTGMNTTGKFTLTATGSPVPTAIVYMIVANPQGGSGTPDLTRDRWVSINVATPTGAQDPNPRLTVVQSRHK